MHASYYFLCSVENADDSEMQADPELVEAAISAFQDFEEVCCDENNYSERLYVVTSGDRFVNCSECSRYERSSIEPVTFAQAKLRAMQAAAYEILGSKEYEKVAANLTSFDELAAFVLTRTPARIASAYVSLPEDMATQNIKFLPTSRRQGMVRGYEALFDSAYGSATERTTPDLTRVPFATNWALTPYGYRCFDLTNGAEPNVILVMDIHT